MDPPKIQQARSVSSYIQPHQGLEVKLFQADLTQLMTPASWIMFLPSFVLSKQIIFHRS